MSNETPNTDPLEFMKGMWGNMGFSLPGMVAPTFDTDELEKRIHDLKAVEGWLRMNLSMLQMTIQGLEMQCSTLSAVKAMGQMAAENNSAGQQTAGEEGAGPFAQAAMWPWSMMQQMQANMQQQAAEQADAEAKPEAPTEPPPAAPKRARKQ
ncbi:MAG: PhaM family polyhydroxyalkanoate granule multifunctional regulatory protein [Rhodocyclaceae bacterium]